MVLTRSGKLQADKVLYDVRNRSFSSLADLGSDHFIAVGSAEGDNGWIAGLENQDAVNPAFAIRAIALRNSMIKQLNGVWYATAILSQLLRSAPVLGHALGGFFTTSYPHSE